MLELETLVKLEQILPSLHSPFEFFSSRGHGIELGEENGKPETRSSVVPL